jgi:transcriptional regulator GlxA family with amidase domain
LLTVGYLVAPGFQMMSFAALSVFEFANVTAGEKLYDVQIISEGGGPVMSSIGMPVGTQSFDGRRFDTLIVGGSMDVMATSDATIAFLQSASLSSRRIASICLGAFALAEAGLLNGRRATTHWFAARELRRRFPAITVEDDRIFIADRGIWTSAGMSAGIDLALSLLEDDMGTEMARTVARKLVLSHRGGGGQSQFSMLLELGPKSDRIQLSLEHARANLRSDLSVEALAEVARLSPRQFSRAFKSETGQSPAKAVERLRVEAARVMVEQGRHSINVVAEEVGFGDAERMRRAFLRVLGQPPQAVRRSARLLVDAAKQPDELAQNRGDASASA